VCLRSFCRRFSSLKAEVHNGEHGRQAAQRRHRRRFGHAQESGVLDPYKRPGKMPEAAACPQCGAVYRAGRWHWGTRPADAHDVVCQACHRINDRYPAGVITVANTLTATEKADMLNLVRHQGTAEKAEHPMNRIIAVDEGPAAIVITTTDIHLPRRIGEAIERAFHGKHTTHFDAGGYFVRVNWGRSDA